MAPLTTASNGDVPARAPVHVPDCSTKATHFREEAEGWLCQPHSSTHLGIRRLSVEVGRQIGWLGEWFLKPMLLHLNLEMHSTTPTASEGQLPSLISWL